MYRIITYDLKSAESTDYKQLYDYIETTNATKITESTYLIKSSLSLEEFIAKIRSLTKTGDNVSVIFNSTNSKYGFGIMKIR